ncbi:hypothetical protein HK097_010035 [Rhizophlyctis rosea]|uniref:BTB domain-containing protein n=1 Tax=Rhizophlyctis rosea TaxID=64517 RepID=A0AAD5S9S7_9FUNG|nr:hypothetical protein HK097_010035 [Rhizophlyctis rosea]
MDTQSTRATRSAYRLYKPIPYSDQKVVMDSLNRSEPVPDVTLVFGPEEGELSAHRYFGGIFTVSNVLVTQRFLVRYSEILKKCEFFALALSGNWAETQSPRPKIKLPTIERATMELVLEYLEKGSSAVKKTTEP